MTRIIYILFILIALTGCRRVKTVTETVIHERIDTTITIAPDTIKWRTPIREIYERPQVIETERVRTVIQVVNDTIEVETFLKPDSVTVYIDRTTKTKTKQTKPVRRYSWLFWYIAGLLTVIGIRLSKYL